MTDVSKVTTLIKAATDRLVYVIEFKFFGEDLRMIIKLF